MLLAFKAYAKAIGKTSEINFGSKGGATFIEAVKIRDKIMHPKSSADWEINDSDYDILREAWLWFTKSLCESGKIAEAF